MSNSNLYISNKTTDSIGIDKKNVKIGDSSSDINSSPLCENNSSDDDIDISKYVRVNMEISTSDGVIMI